MAQTVYTPSKWGAEYHSLTTHEALGAGSAGPGKSLVLLMDPMQQVITEHNRCADPAHPFPLQWGQSVGWALHLRREFPMLEQTIVRAHRIFPQVDPKVRWDSQRHTFVFSSGFRYQFGHCRDPDDWIGYHSNEYTHIAFDELTQFEQEQYDQITSRARTSDPVLRQMLKVRAMSNPVMRREGSINAIKNPFWVRDRFVQPEPQGRKVIKKKIVRRDGTVEYRTRIYLPATLYDNPDPQFVADYEATLLDKPAHIRHALLYGNWFITPGSFYGDDWNEQIHVCQPFRIPDHWLRFRSMDWGYKQPGCVYWWAMDDDGTMYAEREYTFQNKDVIDVAKRIGEIERDLGLWEDGRSLITGPADTQLWEQRGDRVLPKAAEMARMGVPWVQADKRSRERAAQLFLGRLRDHGNHTKNPGVVFFDTCRMAKTTIPGIMAQAHNPEAPQDGGEDHWHDAVLYACSFASHGRLGIPPIRRHEREEGDEDAAASSMTFNTGRYSYGRAN